MARARTTLIVTAVLLASIIVDAQTVVPAVAVQAFPTSAIWTIEVKAQPIAPPVSSSDRLFLALQSGITARRLADGTEIWTAPLAVDGPMAASDERLVVVVKEELQALDTTKGAVMWTDRPGRLSAPPLVHGEWLLVASGEHVTCYRVADGTKVWSRETGAVEQRPAVEGARVYVPAADGRVLALDLKTGEQVWEFTIGIKPTEPLVYDGRIFLGAESKQFCSLRPDTGKEHWCFPVGAGVIGRPVADATHVYFVAYDTNLRALDRKSGAYRWKADLRYRPSSGPLLVGASIAVPGTVPRVQVFDTRQGSKTIDLTLPTRLATAPLLLDASADAPARIAAMTGGLQNTWTVLLAGPAPVAPASPPIAPLTELPGQAIPIGAPPALPGRQSPTAARPLRSDPPSAPRTTAG